MKNFYISLIIGIFLISGIFGYQKYVEAKSKKLIENVGITEIDNEWNSLKTLLYAFNDHERVEEIDNEYIGLKNTKDENIKNMHKVYFKKKLEELIDASKVKIVNIL